MYVDRKPFARRADKLTFFNPVADLYHRFRRRADMLRKQYLNFVETILYGVVERGVFLVFLYAEPCNEPFERYFSVFAGGV